MKSVFIIIFSSILLSVTAIAEAQATDKSKIVNIKTSAICGSCKKRIEKAVREISGVQDAVLNLNTKKLKVKYDLLQTTPDAIRSVIAKAGYHADGVKRDESAYNQLPECCQRVVPGDLHR